MTEEMEDLQDIYPGAGTFKFGDSAALCERLNALVRSGEKTAICDVLANYTNEPEAMPKVGRCDIATDWQAVPTLVIRTTRVDKIRFCDVSEESALAEGENSDLDGWRADHKALFGRNGGFDPEMMLLFEHFELVEDLADR